MLGSACWPAADPKTRGRTGSARRHLRILRGRVPCPQGPWPPSQTQSGPVREAEHRRLCFRVYLFLPIVRQGHQAWASVPTWMSPLHWWLVCVTLCTSHEYVCWEHVHPLSKDLLSIYCVRRVGHEEELAVASRPWVCSFFFTLPAWTLKTCRKHTQGTPSPPHLLLSKV